MNSTLKQNLSHISQCLTNPQNKSILFFQISNKPICKLQFSHKEKERTWNSTTDLNRLRTILKHYTTELLFPSNRASTGNTVSTSGGDGVFFIRHLDTTGTATNYAGKPRRRWGWWKRSRSWQIHCLRKRVGFEYTVFHFTGLDFGNGGKVSIDRSFTKM